MYGAFLWEIVNAVVKIAVKKGSDRAEDINVVNVKKQLNPKFNTNNNQVDLDFDASLK